MSCICCGSDERQTYPLPSHLGNFQACAFCLRKHSPEELAHEADRILTILHKPRQPHCLICGTPLFYDEKERIPRWCDRCEAQRLAHA